MKTKMIALMVAGLLTMSLVAPAFAGSTKVTYCYANNPDEWSVVTVAEGSAHSNHDGDFIVDFGTTADMCMDLSTV